MNLKLIGAVLVILACGGFGFMIALAHRREVRILKELSNILDAMCWELQCHQLPLSQLCRTCSAGSTGILKQYFSTLAQYMDDQIMPNIENCIYAVMINMPPIPKYVRSILYMFGKQIGRYDIDVQIKGLEAVKRECDHLLKTKTENQEVKLRSYQTLGLCAGAALAILFV